LRSLDAVVEVLGWDEAFLAVETEDPEDFATMIQRQILEATRLHCSVGIGDNKLRAKIATEFGKPQGMFRLTEENWYAVMAERPTDALWGIGRKTAKRLAALGITTVAELSSTEAQWLAERLGPTMGPWYRRLARGVDSSPVIGSPYVNRSHSRESTFQQNLTDPSEAESEVRRLARQVTDDIRGEKRPAVRVAVKVRFAPFDTHTRSLTLAEPTSDPGRIEEAAVTLLNRFDGGKAIRLLGVRAEMAEPAE
jgi:DNA polymerase IV